METQSLNRFSRWHYAGLGVALLAMLVYVFLHAWVAEDAYITFRVVDNFFHGYGLRWNVNARVQAYTHPLWMLLQLAVHAVWPNPFHAVIALSIACVAAAIVITLCTVRRPLLPTLVCLFLPLVLSKAFMDYTTSGLENPLSFLLYAAFGYVLVRRREHPYFWFYVSLTVALALLTRLDTIFLYAPILAWLVFTQWRGMRWRQVALGALPLLAWHSFSLFYYGFLFPNTKYAKLDTGLSMLHYLQQGWHYTAVLFTMETVSGIIILLPLAALLVSLAKRPMPAPAVCLILGLYWYCCYVIAIGGDYMMGRFWALPVFVAVWLGYVYLPARLRPDIMFAFVGLLLVTSLTPPMLRQIHSNCRSCTTGLQQMLNARHRFWPNQLVASLHPFRLRDEGQYVFAATGTKLSKEFPPPVQPMYFVGMIGYYAGPKATLIDELALTDPLLAHLPAVPGQWFFIGHFRRAIPKGYVYAVATGDTNRMDPALAQYYQKLRLITSGNLMSLERLKTIIAFNLGMYDHWKEEYLNRRQQ